MPELSSSPPLEGAVSDRESKFVASTGFVAEEVSGTRIAGYVDLGADHHTPWGVVHGGVYAAIVETAGSFGASVAVAERGQYAVGVHNSTNFLRSTSGCRASVLAEPLHQGRVQQLWKVVVTDEVADKILALGELRLQNVPLPQSG
ncbi:PaaI family thioesterase [Nocardia wallacei]|uniref:Thioesterase domain-containing protein n=1 Tax=Nocardia wallacei TaxID=480035 RepID=A0A7G1KKC3_9NOCA|nr:PaaI family thioesterase [Nocardia wallacei]BCK55301.1 hypothetical protein NWFMUON74_30730 [Nocardia wallacei]